MGRNLKKAENSTKMWLFVWCGILTSSQLFPDRLKIKLFASAPLSVACRGNLGPSPLTSAGEKIFFTESSNSILHHMLDESDTLYSLHSGMHHTSYIAVRLMGSNLHPSNLI